MIYAGNYGGFETIGKTIEFQTPISRIFFFFFLLFDSFLRFEKLLINQKKKAPTKLETEVGSTWIYLSWDNSHMATSYSIVLFTP